MSSSTPRLWLLPLFDREENRIPVLFGVLRLSAAELRDALTLRYRWSEARGEWPELLTVELDATRWPLRVVEVPEPLEIRHIVRRTPFGQALERLLPGSEEATVAAIPLPLRNLPRALPEVMLEGVRLRVNSEGMAWEGRWLTPALREQRRRVWTPPLSWEVLLRK